MKEKKERSVTEKLKEGLSVEEMQSFARKYLVEGFLVLAIIIATISSVFNFFTGPGWSILAVGVGTIASLSFPKIIESWFKKISKFLLKPDRTFQIIMGVLKLIVALFMPFLLFIALGIFSGLFISTMFKNQYKSDVIIEEEDLKP